MISRFLAHLVATAAALAVATWLLPGIVMHGSSTGHRALTLLVVALVFGVLNSLVKPLFEFATGCLIVASLGLFLWVVNAAMLKLTSAVCGHWNIPWHVNTWGAAFAGALIVSFVGTVLGWALKPRELA